MGPTELIVLLVPLVVIGLVVWIVTLAVRRR